MSKKEQGFASLSPEERKKRARQGGKAAAAQGKLHKFTGEQRSAGGKKAGSAVSRDREHMAEIGRKGGRSKGKRKEAAE